MRVLVVDDDPDFCEGLADVLKAYGHDCFCVGDGVAALDTINEFGRPDLILLDLGLPVMDGFEFRQRQLVNPAIAAIPCIVVSGYHLNGAWRHQLAALDYFTKPIDIPALIQAIEAVGRVNGEPF